MKTSIAIVLASLAASIAIATASSAPIAPRTPAKEVESSIVSVDSNTSVTEHAGALTLPTTYIVGRLPRVQRQTAQCGAFQARDLTQGFGTVRGFCL